MGAVAVGWTPAPARDVTMTRPESQVEAWRSMSDLDGADDHGLVAAFRAGRREAFDLIVERHRRHVYQLCFRFTGNHEDASDLAQDVFVRAFKGLQKFKNESALSTWLYRVTVNTCLNRAAAKKPDPEPIESVTLADERSVDPLKELERGERAEAVRRAIRKLPPKQRATLVLRMYEDLSHEEIAAILGGSIGAAKANLFHALGNLRRLLRPS
jgi:RNA polymerase sigma-70 factor, ECF subfamily